jgi:hypothetical protein
LTRNFSKTNPPCDFLPPCPTWPKCLLDKSFWTWLFWLGFFCWLFD